MKKTGMISAAKFKATCLELMDEVASTHREILITKRGKPVAKLVAAGSPPALFGSLSGTVQIRGDIVSPTGEAWEADEEP